MTTLWRAMTSAPDAFCAFVFWSVSRCDVGRPFSNRHDWVMVLYIRKVFDASVFANGSWLFFKLSLKPKGSPRYLFHKCDGPQEVTMKTWNLAVQWVLPGLQVVLPLIKQGIRAKMAPQGHLLLVVEVVEEVKEVTWELGWWKLMIVSLRVLPQYATFQDMRPYSKTFFLGEMALEEQPGYRFPW